MDNKFNCKFQAEIWLHGIIDEAYEKDRLPELLSIKSIDEGALTPKHVTELQKDFETVSCYSSFFKDFETECAYLIDIESEYYKGDTPNENFWDFRFSNAILSMPNIHPINVPTKTDEYDNRGYLNGMEVGDYIVTTSDNIKLITDDNMPDLHFSQIKRFATLSEILETFQGVF